jgi:hypothetical protein
MARKVSKNDILRRIKELDELEIIIEEISRSESSSKKQNQLSSFTREAKRQIDDSRDVILIAVALK